MPGRVASPELPWHREVVAVSWSPELPAAGQPVTFTAVVRNVQVWVDDVDRIDETNEGNNTTTATLTVP